MQNLAGGTDVGGNTRSRETKANQNSLFLLLKNGQELAETVLMQHGLKLIIIWRDENM